jgi:hypothetical protein
VFADRRGKLIDHGAEHEQRRALGPHRVAAQTRHGDPAAQAQEAGAHRGALIAPVGHKQAPLSGRVPCLTALRAFVSSGTDGHALAYVVAKVPSFAGRAGAPARAALSVGVARVAHAE